MSTQLQSIFEREINDRAEKRRKENLSRKEGKNVELFGNMIREGIEKEVFKMRKRNPRKTKIKCYRDIRNSLGFSQKYFRRILNEKERKKKYVKGDAVIWALFLTGNLREFYLLMGYSGNEIEYSTEFDDCKLCEIVENLLKDEKADYTSRVINLRKAVKETKLGYIFR